MGLIIMILNCEKLSACDYLSVRGGGLWHAATHFGGCDLGRVLLRGSEVASLRVRRLISLRVL